MDNEADRLITVGQAAERLGLRESTIRNWLALGKLPRVQLSSRAVRISADAVRRLVSERTNTAGQK